MRAVFRIDFDSSLFDRLLIRTLFHRCAQCFVDMILFDPTSPSVKSYQLVEVVSGDRAPGKSSSLASPQFSNWTISLFWGRAVAAASCCCCCCLLLLLLRLRLPSAAAAASCCCLLLLPPAAASCCCLLLLLPPAAAAASACCCCCLLLLLLPPAAAAASSSSCCCFLLLLLLLLLLPPAAAATGANILPKKKITVSVALFGAGGRYGRETPAERGNVYRRQNL